MGELTGNKLKTGPLLVCAQEVMPLYHRRCGDAPVFGKNYGKNGFYRRIFAQIPGCPHITGNVMMSLSGDKCLGLIL